MSDNHTHHHSLLAGVPAGVVAVIMIPLLAIWLARHLVTEALSITIWVLTGLVIAGALAAVLLAYRYLWHRHVQFSAAAPARPVLTARVLPADHAELPAAQPAALPAPAAVHLHLPDGMPPEHVAGLLRGLQSGEAVPGITAAPEL
jgi:hypothetical protein